MRALIALAIALLAQLAIAQDFPTRAVRLVVPFPPGGPLDVTGRLIAQHLGDLWKQPIIVENRAGGFLGPEAVAKAPPDGYTLLIISSTPFVTLPQMQKVPYEVTRDFTAITQTVMLSYALVASPESGINSVQELVDAAKRAPGKFNYGSAGNGSGQHLLVELFKTAAGIDLTHIPFRGSGPALQAFLGGQFPLMLDVTTATVPLTRSGKAKALFVTGDKPNDAHPGVVPFDSLYPGLDIRNWHGIFAPTGTPAPVLAKAAADIREVLKLPAVGDRFRQLGVEPSGLSGDAFNAVLKRDYERWGEIIRKNNLRAD